MARFDEYDGIASMSVRVDIVPRLEFRYPPKDDGEQIARAYIRGRLKKLAEERAYLYSNDLAEALAEDLDAGNGN